MEAAPEIKAVHGAELGISLVRDDLLFRIQRAIGLIPKQTLGLVRRTLGLSLLAWLPLALWAVWVRRAWPGQTPEPFLGHYIIHVRFLIALPVLILGEAWVHSTTTRLIPEFVNSGVIAEETIAQFKDAIQGIIRLR